MKRQIFALVLTAGLATAIVATPTQAQARWGGWGWGLGGLALGALAGAAIASSTYAWGYPGYYGYGYPAYAAYGYGYPAYSYGFAYPRYAFASYAYAPTFGRAWHPGYHVRRAWAYSGYRLGRRIIHRARRVARMSQDGSMPVGIAAATERGFQSPWANRQESRMWQV